MDDTDYYGPETTTITNPHAGIYSYFVHIYGGGNGKCWDSGISANVEVWSGNKGGKLWSSPQPEENPEPKCPGEVEHTCKQVSERSGGGGGEEDEHTSHY